MECQKASMDELAGIHNAQGKVLSDCLMFNRIWKFRGEAFDCKNIPANDDICPNFRPKHNTKLN